MTKYQREILESKDTVTGIKGVVDSFNSRLNQAEEGICKLEDRPFEIIQ